MKRELSTQIETMKERQQKLAQKLAKLEAKAKAKARANDTRRKIVVGAAIITAMEKDPTLATTVRRILAASVGRPHDKEVIAELMTGKPGTPAASMQDNDIEDADALDNTDTRESA